MMYMSRESWIVRWASLSTADSLPNRVSLCQLFWRFVGVSVVASLVIIACLTCLAMGCLTIAAMVTVWPTSVLWASVVFGAGMCLLSIFAPPFVQRRELQRRGDFKPSFVEVAAIAYKRKICPLIELR